MILVRQTFQAKYGRGDELVGLFKELHARAEFPHRDSARILTDASGRFFTVITEYETESLGTWEATFAQLMSHPEMGAWFGRMTDVTESGSRDFYTIVS
ncbi:MAG: hypothetical protein WC211_01785 [Dehalococcoidia bacterium]|jgi:hypothetical protein